MLCEKPVLAMEACSAQMIGSFIIASRPFPPAAGWCGGRQPMVLRLHCLLSAQGLADLESLVARVHIGVICFELLSPEGFGLVGCVAARHSGFARQPSRKPHHELELHRMRVGSENAFITVYMLQKRAAACPKAHGYFCDWDIR